MVSIHDSVIFDRERRSGTSWVKVRRRALSLALVPLSLILMGLGTLAMSIAVGLNRATSMAHVRK
ncbi:hypothetical protein GCM10011390_08550 [Aureimonas endophytica]|uniref:Uncharacterized protein n=1 Tax=Aureimonas endophytica TaxID=2027858 RepID=A0A917E0P7_9HYPH|nr:hypothetical protein GCM10011390_08550 [Aureimonas endophytica]